MAGQDSGQESGQAAGQGTRAAALLQPEMAALRRAGRLSVLAGLMWLPMAWLAAGVLADLIRGISPDGVKIAGFAGLWAVQAMLSSRADARAQALALAAVGRIRRAVLGRGHRQAYPVSAGGFASLVGDQIEMLRPYAARFLTVEMRARILPLAILAACLPVSWVAALVLLVTGPVIPVFMALIGQAAERVSRAQLQQMGTMSAELAERVAALPDIRLLGTRDALVADFTQAADGLRQRTMRVLTIAFLSSTVLELFAAIGVAMLAIYCGFSLLGVIGFGTWGQAMTPEQGLFLLLLAPEFFQPLRDLAGNWHARAAADAVAAALAESAQGDEIAGEGAQAEPLAGVLALRGVMRHGIRFPDLEIAADDSLALIGPSGAGKTTLLRLIAGLERPDHGEITLDGQALEGALADRWRAALGWMPQSPHFLDASLEDNLRMGRAGDLAPALAMAAAVPVVAALPHGLAQHLGESGSGVSGGEARRLTLARALHGGARLILADEPTADLDEQTAALVTAGLMAARAGGRGLVLATHDRALAGLMARRIEIGVQGGDGSDRGCDERDGDERGSHDG